MGSYALEERLPTESWPRMRQKHHARGGSMTVMLAVLKVDLESHDRMLAKRNQTALTPLAVGTHDAALEVEVRQRQSH